MPQGPAWQKSSSEMAGPHPDFPIKNNGKSNRIPLRADGEDSAQPNDKANTRKSMQNEPRRRRELPVEIQLSRVGSTPNLLLPGAGGEKAGHMPFCNEAGEPMVTKSRRLIPRPERTGLCAEGDGPGPTPSRIEGAEPNMILPKAGMPELDLVKPFSSSERSRCKRSGVGTGNSVRESPNKKDVKLRPTSDRTAAADSTSHMSKVNRKNSHRAHPKIRKVLPVQLKP